MYDDIQLLVQTRASRKMYCLYLNRGNPYLLPWQPLLLSSNQDIRCWGLYDCAITTSFQICLSFHSVSCYPRFALLDKLRTPSLWLILLLSCNHELWSRWCTIKPSTSYQPNNQTYSCSNSLTEVNKCFDSPIFINWDTKRQVKTTKVQSKARKLLKFPRNTYWRYYWLYKKVLIQSKSQVIQKKRSQTRS